MLPTTLLAYTYYNPTRTVSYILSLTFLKNSHHLSLTTRYIIKNLRRGSGACESTRLPVWLERTDAHVGVQRDRSWLPYSYQGPDLLGRIVDGRTD
jgi:hypothetical protein